MTCDIQPMAFNVVVELDPIEKVRPSGLIIPDSKTERDKLAADEGTLVALSPHAFSYAEWPDGARKPQLGDRVLVNRYQGVIRDVDDKSYRIVEDKMLVAVLTQGEA